MRNLKDYISPEEYDRLWADDKKFLSNTSLWLFTHPAKWLKLNKVVKSSRNEIFKNLISNVLNGKWRVINDLDKIRLYFWNYFNENKKFGVYNSFSDIGVELWDYKMNLKKLAVLLNFINDNIKSQISYINKIKITFEPQWELDKFSQWEFSIEVDEQNEKYNWFIKNRLIQYRRKFSNWDIDAKDIIFYYLCRHKFNDFDFLQSLILSRKVNVLWLDLSVGQYLAVLDILDINKTLELNKKI